MTAPPKKRLEEGALSALRTPQQPPPPAKPALAQSEGQAGRRVSEAAGMEAVTRIAVERAQGDDAEGLMALNELYAPDVLGFANSLVKDTHEAEEITHRVFVELPTSIKLYNSEEDSFKAWIMRITRRAVLDYLRGKSDMSVVRVADVGSGVDRSEDLRLALEQLPEDQREVLILRHIAGLSPVEIAETLKKSESAVHGLQHRGRHSLREQLRQLSAQQAALEELIEE